MSPERRRDGATRHTRRGHERLDRIVGLALWLSAAMVLAFFAAALWLIATMD